MLLYYFDAWTHKGFSSMHLLVLLLLHDLYVHASLHMFTQLFSFFWTFQVVRQMMWLMDHIFKYTNFGIVSLIHGDFFIRQVSGNITVLWFILMFGYWDAVGLTSHKPIQVDFQDEITVLKCVYLGWAYPAYYSFFSLSFLCRHSS